MTMDKDVKTAWTTALRSGKYEQTGGTLKRGRPTTSYNEKDEPVLDPPQYCCLGVLCEVLPAFPKYADLAYISITDGYIAIHSMNSDGENESTMNNIPLQLARPLGLGETTQVEVAGNKETKDIQSYLMRMNDTLHKSFAEIADEIDRLL